MADKIEFRKKLKDILEFSLHQGSEIAFEEVEKFFEEDLLSKEQIQLVCDYLMSQKILVTGITMDPRVVKEVQEEPEKLSDEEEHYLQEYMRDIKQIQLCGTEEARMAYYLPKVVEEALRLHTSELFIGDMIQEGNISLVMALEEYESENEEAVMNAIRTGISMLIQSQDETKRQDKRMLERVAELDELIKNMTEELGRKVTIEEVADKMGIAEAEIEDILKLAGEEIE